MHDIDDHLHSLAYVSRSKLGGDVPTVHREIERILARSRSSNEGLGVTGLLMFDKVCFAQILEGPRCAVERVFERIRTDRRHGDIVLLTNEALHARAFGDWSMACVEGEAGLLDRYFTCRASGPATEMPPPCDSLLMEVEYLAGRSGRTSVACLLDTSGNIRPGA